MIKSFVSAAFILAAPFAASATVINVTGTASGESFTRFPTSTGAHGLELRAGKKGNRGDWELGLGPATSTQGSFTQAQQDWGSYQSPTTFAFELVYSGHGDINSGNASFWMWENGLMRPSNPVLSWNTGGLLTGNAVAIASKGLASIDIAQIDGMDVDYSLATTAVGQFEELVFYSEDLADGFNVAGTLSINPKYYKSNGNKPGWKDAGSRNEIFIKPGTVTAPEPSPVPLPAALPLLLAGLGGFAAFRLRKQQ